MALLSGSTSVGYFNEDHCPQNGTFAEDCVFSYINVSQLKVPARIALRLFFEQTKRPCAQLVMSIEQRGFDWDSTMKRGKTEIRIQFFSLIMFCQLHSVTYKKHDISP